MTYILISESGFGLTANGDTPAEKGLTRNRAAMQRFATKRDAEQAMLDRIAAFKAQGSMPIPLFPRRVAK